MSIVQSMLVDDPYLKAFSTNVSISIGGTRRVIVDIEIPVNGGVAVETYSLKVDIASDVGNLIGHSHCLLLDGDISVFEYVGKFDESIFSFGRCAYHEAIERVEGVEKEVRTDLGFENRKLGLVALRLDLFLRKSWP